MKKGRKVTFTLNDVTGSYVWSGPDGFIIDSRMLVLKKVARGGIYTLNHKSEKEYKVYIIFSFIGRES